MTEDGARMAEDLRPSGGGADDDLSAVAAEATRQSVESATFVAAVRRAEQVVGDPGALRGVAVAAATSAAVRSGPFLSMVEEFRDLVRLAVAASRGGYRPRSQEALVHAVAALLYVVDPADVVPDDTPMIGYLDDAAVVSWAVRHSRRELDRFRSWQLGLTD